jgi:hypothetical protein
MEVFGEHHILLLVVASAVSYALTQILKPFIWVTAKDKAKAIIRLCAVICGAIVGYSLHQTILDLWIGASAGAMNAFLIALVKKKAKSVVSLSIEKDEDKKEKEKA